MQSPPKILVIDDEEESLKLIKEIFVQGFEVECLIDPRRASEQLQGNFYHVVITDLKMPFISGIEVLKAVKASNPLTEIIIMTGYGEKGAVIEALRYGGFDLVEKPIDDIPFIKNAVKKAIEKVELALENKRLVEDLKAANIRIEGQRIKDLQRIEEIGQALATSLDQQAILTILAKSLIDGTACDAVGLSFYNLGKRGATLTIFGSLAEDDISHIKYKMLEDIKSLIPYGSTKFYGDEEEIDLRVNPMVKNPDRADLSGGPMVSISATPLVWKGELEGILSIFSKRPEAFNKDDTRVLSILATNATIALRNARVFNEIHEMANRDGMTDLFNHRHFQEILDIEIARAIRFGHPLSLLMLDIDFFKNVNDSYGHPAGDQLLFEFGRLLKDMVRKTDSIARYGGDEFTVILTETPLSGAMPYSERIRKKVEERAFRVYQEEVKLTVSIGVANFSPDALGFDQGLVRKELIEMADQGLYRAKKGGRNRCEYGGHDLALSFRLADSF